MMTPDFQAIHSTIVERLPLQARWWIKETHLDHDFASGHRGLRSISREMFNYDPSREEWFDLLLIFGQRNDADGGGAQPLLGIRKTDGAVMGLDVERDEEALFPLNSSIERFVETFAYLNAYLGFRKDLPPDTSDRLRAIDPHTYPTSDWRAMVEFALLSED